MPAPSLIALPDDSTDDAAAQLLVSSVTARHVLRAALGSTDALPSNLVLTGASSSVGTLMAVQALRERLHVIRFVRSSEATATLADLLPGGDVVATASTGWPDEVRRLADGDIPLVIDAVGGLMVAAGAHLLNAGGTLVSFGLLDGSLAGLTMFNLKRLSLRSVNMGTWRADATPRERAANIALVIAAASAPAKSGAVLVSF